jgi:hypothetical protein
MYRDFNEVSYGDVLVLDKTIYIHGMDASGSVLLVGQHGSLDEGQDMYEESVQNFNFITAFIPFADHCHPMPFDAIGEKGELLAGKIFVVTQTQMDGMTEEQATFCDYPNLECGTLVTAREIEAIGSDYTLKQDGLIIQFHQGTGFEYCLHFPQKIGTLKVKRTYTVSGFIPL